MAFEFIRFLWNRCDDSLHFLIASTRRRPPILIRNKARAQILTTSSNWNTQMITTRARASASWRPSTAQSSVCPTNLSFSCGRISREPSREFPFDCAKWVGLDLRKGNVLVWRWYHSVLPCPLTVGIYLSQDRDVAFSFLKPGPNGYTHSLYGARMGCIICAEVSIVA